MSSFSGQVKSETDITGSFNQVRQENQVKFDEKWV
jgi:hypothetical protein